MFLLPCFSHHKLYNDLKHRTKTFLALLVFLHQRVDMKFFSKLSTVTDAASNQKLAIPPQGKVNIGYCSFLYKQFSAYFTEDMHGELQSQHLVYIQLI
jgi:hypothetical protein